MCLESKAQELIEGVLRAFAFCGEMTDTDTTNEKSVSTLAIVDKRPHKPGGCVGIFFQLFDWNRRFAKKKFFSKKLLPPGLCSI